MVRFEGVASMYVYKRVCVCRLICIGSGQVKLLVESLSLLKNWTSTW